MLFRTTTKPAKIDKITIQKLPNGQFWVEIESKNSNIHYNGYNQIIDDSVSKMLFTAEDIDDIICYVEDASHVTMQGDEIE